MDFTRARRTGITVSLLSDEVDQLRYSLGTENTMMVFPRQALRVILNGPSLYEPFELGSL